MMEEGRAWADRSRRLGNHWMGKLEWRLRLHLGVEDSPRGDGRQRHWHMLANRHPWRKLYMGVDGSRVQESGQIRSFDRIFQDRRP